MLRRRNGAVRVYRGTEWQMNKGWVGWLGFIVLCGLVLVSSCQAWRADPSAPAGEAESVKSE
jgi:hypothetical protein